MREGTTTQAGELAGNTLNKLFGHSKAWSQASRVLHVWHTMRNETIKRHTCGVSLREHRVSKELIVYVDSNAWMYECTMRAPEVLQEWNMRCEGAQEDLKVSKVTFKLATRARDAGYTQTLATNDTQVELPPAPLSNEELSQVQQTVSAIDDKNLRTHAQNAMISVMRWKKSKK